MDLRIAVALPLIAALSAPRVLPAVTISLNAAAVALVGRPALGAARRLIDDGLLRSAVLALPLATVTALPLATVPALIGLRTLGARRLVAHLGIARAAIGTLGPTVGTLRALQLLARRRSAALALRRATINATVGALMGGGRLASAAPAITALLAPVFLTGAAPFAAITLLSRLGGMGGQGGGRDRQELRRRGEDRRQRRCCEELGHHRAGPFCSGAGT